MSSSFTQQSIWLLSRLFGRPFFGSYLGNIKIQFEKFLIFEKKGLITLLLDLKKYHVMLPPMAVSL
jgi:hypothetical protein